MRQAESNPKVVPQEVFDAVMAEACVADFITALGDPLYEVDWGSPPFTTLIEEYGLQHIRDDVHLLALMTLEDARDQWPETAARLSKLAHCPHCSGLVLEPKWDVETEDYQIVCQSCGREV